MFENVESAKPEKYWFLWASLKAVGFGVACFFPAFFLSLLVTIPWSKHHWPGEGQAVLGGIVVSFWFGIAFSIAASAYLLLRTIPIRMPRLQKYVDYGCAWVVLALGVLGIVRMEAVHSANAVLDAPLLWVLLAMLNLLRLRNGYGVTGLRVFCIAANVAVLVLEAVRFRMFGTVNLVVALPILAETLFSIGRNDPSVVLDC